jgi:Protein of unknown function (DUF1161)
MAMGKLIAAVLVLGLSGSAWAQVKPCEELKSEIEAKLKAKGVAKYSLDIVAAADAKGDGQVVGSCEGGSKRIVYKRN